MRGKTKLKIMKVWRKKARVKVRFLALAGILVYASFLAPNINQVKAESCPDLKIIFARGSGAKRWEDKNYLEFKDRIEEKLSGNFSYDFLDLDYPAIGVGADNLGVLLGAFFGAGDAYEFGDSINAGVKELLKQVNDGCPKTKYVIGGYSQGAMVISKALSNLNAEKIIYAATFGDPKIYLPEGAGPVPVACSGKNLSDYRAYVPDCRAYEGLLGSRRPYQPENFSGKLGTWCNKYDIFCSSYFSINSHISYVSDNLYEDASRVIISKISSAFNIKNEYSSPHDTVILIDSTGSMKDMISRFKKEALRLADETFKMGGRVALYDYRDLSDPYEPVARCSFETCTSEKFAEALDSIILDGGGDEPESLLSASFKVMNELKWRKGATKSLVVLTDAPFLNPDYDGVTMNDVINLSKRIDPVNFYIITDEIVANEHPEIEELALRTDGMLVTEFGNLNFLTNYIIERRDALPKVEEDENCEPLPELEITEFLDMGEKVEVRFKNTGSGAIIILNDAILGITNNSSAEISNLDRDRKNELTLIPISDSRRGEKTKIDILTNPEKAVKTEKSVPKTPDTGVAN